MEHARIEKAVFDLFNIERAFIPTPKDKPRKATDSEVRAYAEWLALQAGLYPGFSSSIETVGSWSRQCDNRRTMGVTFGDVLKGRHYCPETRARFQQPLSGELNPSPPSQGNVRRFQPLRRHRKRKSLFPLHRLHPRLRSRPAMIWRTIWRHCALPLTRMVPGSL
jgi:hypothetical protein